MVKFLTEEWFTIAQNVAIQNLDPQKDLKNATASLLNVIHDVPPDGRTLYFYISVKNGIISEMILDEKDSLLEKNAEFVITGNYDIFSQIIKGEMNTLIALLKNRVQIKGNKSKAMQFARPIDKLNACLREIDTEY